MNNAKGYASVWRRENSKIKASGQISVKPEVLRQWLELPVDSYGNVSLDLVLFGNDKRTNDRSPHFNGYLQVDQRQQAAQNPAPQQAAPMPAQEPDYDTIPF